MIFCGQCGLQLAPGSTRCPRCGAEVEPSDIATEGALHSDDATIASPSLKVQTPSRPNNGPQPLVLRPDSNPGNYDYNAQATSRVESPQYGGQAMGTSYPGVGYQQSYPDYGTQQAGGYSTVQGQGISYPGTLQQGGYTQPYIPDQQERTASKGRVASIVIILIGILLIISAAVLFIIQQNSHASAGNATPPAVTQTVNQATTPTTEQQAQSVVQLLYDSVNKKDYTTAYNQWQTPPETLAQFKDGYKHTKHDDVTYESSVKQADGTVKVTVTIDATESMGQGERHTTYKGYYIVAQQSDGSWKITKGTIAKQ